MATGVVEANKRLSDIQGAFQDRGAQFFKGYEKSLEAKKEREAKNKETQARVNGLMDQFKNEVDVLKFKPEDQTLVKNTIVGWRQEYADAANAAAQIQDKSSAEYQQYMDIMNGIQNKMTNLKNNIDNLAAFKKEYADNIKAGHYSNAGANDMALAQGEIMFQYPIGSISDSGDLMWDDEGTGAFGFQDYEMPFEKATGLATALGKIADPIRMQKTPLDDLQRREIKEKVDALVRDPKALASLVSDSDLPGFDFSNIDPEDPNAKEQVADLLVRSIEGLRGKGVVQSNTGQGGRGGAMVSQRLMPTYKNMQADQEALVNSQKGATPVEINNTYNLGTSTRPLRVTVTNDGWTVEDVNAGYIESYNSLEDLQVSNPNLFK